MSIALRIMSQKSIYHSSASTFVYSSRKASKIVRKTWFRTRFTTSKFPRIFALSSDNVALDSLKRLKKVFSVFVIQTSGPESSLISMTSSGFFGKKATQCLLSSPSNFFRKASCPPCKSAYRMSTNLFSETECARIFWSTLLW